MRPANIMLDGHPLLASTSDPLQAGVIFVGLLAIWILLRGTERD